MTGSLGGLGRRIYGARAAYMFLLPAAIAVVFLQLIPAIRAVDLSLYAGGPLNFRFAGFGNYSRMMADPVALRAIRNTITLVIIVVPAVTILSLLIASFIETFPMRWRPIYRGAFYLPVVAGSVLLAIVWRWIYNPAYGILPAILSTLGITHPPVFLGDPAVAIWAVGAVAVAYHLGVPILVYSAAISGIPTEIVDAARMDGANERQVFWHITLPLVRQATVFVIVINTIVMLQVWDIIQIMTLGGPEYSTVTLGYLVYTSAFAFGQFGYASAVAVVLMTLVFAVAIIQLRLIARGQSGVQIR